MESVDLSSPINGHQRNRLIVAPCPAPVEGKGRTLFADSDIAARCPYPKLTECQRFDRLARHYFWMECVLAGRKLQRCRTAFLREVASVRSALIFGEGNGRFVCELLKASPQAEVVCVEGSAEMLRIAQERVLRQGLDVQRVEFVHADVFDDSLEWRSQKFDLVVTHFFLDCFRDQQLRELIPAVANATTNDAFWLLADFRVPERGFARWRARAILWLAYRFFRVAVRLPASRLSVPDEFLKASNFCLAERRLYESGLLHSDLWRKRAE